MNEMTCADVVDRLPELAAGGLERRAAAALDEHLSGCAACAAEAEFVRGLRASRPAPPAELAARVSAALRAQPLAPSRARVRSLRPTWALPAAAVLVLAIGVSVLNDRAAAPAALVGLGEVAVVEDADAGVWIPEDGEVAGAPVLDDLTDEALATLLEEIGG